MLEFYKNYIGDKINEEMIQRLPGKDVDGVIAVNFKPQAIKDLLKELNMDGTANAGLGQLNLTLDDITNAFKGDILFGATDFKMLKDSVDESFNGTSFKSTKESTLGNFVFAASIGDKDAFNKILNTAKKLIAQSRGDDTATNLPFSMDNNGTYFVVSNSKDNTSQYLAGANNTKFDFISNINGQPFGAYVNLQSLIKATGSMIDNDSSSQAIYDASLKMWDNIYIKGGSLDGDVSTSTLDVNLVDNSTNSLKQLSEYISKISGIVKQKEDAENVHTGDVQVDTTSVAVPSADNHSTSN
jgi:hypothetical protein